MIDTICQVFIAIGTVAVALLAIWGEKIRALIVGPKLTIQLRDPQGNLTTRADGRRTIYYHVRVVNARRWSPAKSVRILVTQISRRRPDGSFFPETMVAPLQLTWAFPSFHELLPTITSTDVCDIGFLDEDANRFALSTYITPNNFQGFVGPNEAIRVHVIASAHNSEMKRPFILEIAWNGRWSDNMADMERNLVVRDVSDQEQRHL